jgi:hypothetical protein
MTVDVAFDGRVGTTKKVELFTYLENNILGGNSTIRSRSALPGPGYVQHASV